MKDYRVPLLVTIPAAIGLIGVIWLLRRKSSPRDRVKRGSIALPKEGSHVSNWNDKAQLEQRIHHVEKEDIMVTQRKIPDSLARDRGSSDLKNPEFSGVSAGLHVESNVGQKSEDKDVATQYGQGDSLTSSRTCLKHPRTTAMGDGLQDTASKLSEPRSNSEPFSQHPADSESRSETFSQQPADSESSCEVETILQHDISTPQSQTIHMPALELPACDACSHHGASVHPYSSVTLQPSACNTTHETVDASNSSRVDSAATLNFLQQQIVSSMQQTTSEQQATAMPSEQLSTAVPPEQLSAAVQHAEILQKTTLLSILQDTSAVSSPQQTVVSSLKQESLVLSPQQTDVSLSEQETVVSSPQQTVVSLSEQESLVSSPQQTVVSLSEQETVVSSPQETVVSPPQQFVVSLSEQETVVSMPQQTVVSLSEQETLVSSPQQSVVSSSKQESLVSSPQQADVSLSEQETVVSSPHQTVVSSPEQETIMLSPKQTMISSPEHETVVSSPHIVVSLSEQKTVVSSQQQITMVSSSEHETSVSSPLQETSVSRVLSSDAPALEDSLSLVQKHGQIMTNVIPRKYLDQMDTLSTDETELDGQISEAVMHVSGSSTDPSSSHKQARARSPSGRQPSTSPSCIDDLHLESAEGKAGDIQSALCTESLEVYKNTIITCVSTNSVVLPLDRDSSLKQTTSIHQDASAVATSESHTAVTDASESHTAVTDASESHTAVTDASESHTAVTDASESHTAVTDALAVATSENHTAVTDNYQPGNDQSIDSCAVALSNKNTGNESAAKSDSPACDNHSEGSNDSGRGVSEHDVTCQGSESLVHFDFNMPSELCGRFIGRHGKNINFLKSTTGAHVSLTNDPYSTDYQICQIVGSQAEVDDALAMIRRKFPQHDYPLLTMTPINMPHPAILQPEHQFILPDIMQLSLPEGVSVDVFVSAIVDAGHLFVQQPTHRSFMSLEKLNYFMNLVYGQDPDVPSVPAPVESGIICVCEHGGFWYRAMAVTPEDENGESQVKFVDYGGYAMISVHSLKQIRADFMTLPFQAVECFLANVTPNQNEQFFSDAATQALSDMTQGKLLQCQVVARVENGTPYIHLYQISTENNSAVMINRALVNSQLARWIEIL